eukprot:4413115-Lingulodinium_polyedra.AAC.1
MAVRTLATAAPSTEAPPAPELQPEVPPSAEIPQPVTPPRTVAPRLRRPGAAEIGPLPGVPFAPREPE